MGVTLNQELQGDFFVQRTADGDFLLRGDDLRKMRIVHLAEATGSDLYALKKIPGITFTYSETDLILAITVTPEALKRKEIDLTEAGRQQKVVYPKDNSIFFNYNLFYGTGTGFDFEDFSLTGELGLRLSDVLFLTDAVYNKTTDDETITRLMSAAVYDRRSHLDTVTLGDFYGTSGNFGSTINMAGLSYAKNYKLDPYVIKQPFFDYSGVVRTPSEIDIYLDGARVGHQKLSPGGFDLKNVATYGGIHNLELVIRDAFGREERVQNLFYVSNTLLAEGLKEFSYNIGFRRNNYGLESNRYGPPPSFSGFIAMAGTARLRSDFGRKQNGISSTMVPVLPGVADGEHWM